MTRNRAGTGNVPTAVVARYYEQRASAGLLVTEGTQVALEGVGYPNTPGIYSTEQVAGWPRVVAAARERALDALRKLGDEDLDALDHGLAAVRFLARKTTAQPLHAQMPIAGSACRKRILQGRQRTPAHTVSAYWRARLVLDRWLAAALACWRFPREPRTARAPARAQRSRSASRRPSR